MKHFLIFLLFPISFIAFSQPNTEIFLFDLNIQNDRFELSNFKNVSNNKGYDNQPSFMDSNTILYAGTRNGQTDIVKYNIVDGTKEWLTDTQGSEYSPSEIPQQNAISAIRLDTDGKQLLYRYDLESNTSKPLMDALVVGYHTWFDKHSIVSSVLEDDSMSLYVTNITTNSNRKIEDNVGRSLHKIPNTDFVSYISKTTDSIYTIRYLNPINGITRDITETLKYTEDMCWLSFDTILMAKDGKLFMYKVKNSTTTWVEVASLKDYGIVNITRLTVSPDGKNLSIVGEQEEKLSWPQKDEKQLIMVTKTTKAPTIDGIADEPIWQNTSWHPIDQRWIGNPYEATDFQGRYKLTWTNDALYVMAEITDDIIFDQYEDPLRLWWDEDCVEVFIDEDNSGGEHQYNHNAFAYHVALDGNVVDMSTDRTGKLYNNHVLSKHSSKANVTTWELKIEIYNDTFDDKSKNNKPVTLHKDKKIGFAIAYCDNDGSVERENFIGSIPVDGEDKNRGWMDANIFGTLILKN